MNNNDESNFNPSPDEPRIIVDEDWKAQVEREKEAVRNQDHTGATDSSGEAQSNVEFPLPPPPNFEGLVSMLASQAMASLGFLPDSSSGKLNVNRPIAKYLIDLLGIVEEKTKGNLTEDEESQLQDALHSMRMLYIEVAREADQQQRAGVKAEPQATRPIIEVP